MSTDTAAVNANAADSPASTQPAKGREREADDDGDEDRRDAVGEPLDRSLATLGVGDELGDLRERGVGTDLGGAHDEPAAGVHGRARTPTLMSVSIVAVPCLGLFP